MSDDLVFPTFTLPRGARPWKAASKDETRPILCHGWLRERDDGWWLLTTDSYIACAVKVQTTGEIVEGQVPRAVLKLMRRGSAATQLADRAWRVRYDGCEWTLRLPDDPATYPDLAALGMWDDSDGAQTDTIGLYPRLSRRLQAAMGSHETGVCFRFTAGPKDDPRTSVVRVCPTGEFGDRRGLQMPVRLS